MGFIPKSRRKTVYGEIRARVGGIFHELARQFGGKLQNFTGAHFWARGWAALPTRPTPAAESAASAESSGSPATDYQPKHLTPQRLQRIGLLLHQAKQEFLLCRRQLSFAASTTLSFAASPSRRFVSGILSCIDSAKCLRQRLKLFVGQSRQRQQSSSVFFQSFIFQHQPIVAYFALCIVFSG